MTTTHEPRPSLNAETRLRHHPDLTATAFHESGHAVAALRSGLVLRSVDTIYTIDRFGAADYEHEHAPRETRELCLLAAGAAERRYTGSHRAMDAGDVEQVGILFKNSHLDPEIPYLKRQAGADAERQQIVNKWYAKAEAFVEREWMWIERVARALQRHERLTGAEVKTLCSHPVVHVDPPVTVDQDARASLALLPTPTGAPDHALVTKIVDTGHNGATKDDSRITAIAQTHTDIPVVDPADAAHAAFLAKYGNKPVTWKKLLAHEEYFFDEILIKIFTRQKAQIEELETRLNVQDAAIATLKAAPILKDAGIWRHGSTYAPGDVAQFKGSPWVCTKAHTASGTPDHSCWRLLLKSSHTSKDVRP